MELKSTSEYIYNDLKSKLTQLEYLPGEKISEPILCEEYETSRTTVKKALLKLDADKLVVVKPRIGSYAAKIDINRLTQLLAVRHAIEYSIFKSVVEKSTKKTINKLNKTIEKQKKYLDKDFTLANSLNIWNLDNEFHKIMFDLTGNQLLWRHIEQNLYQLNRYRVLSHSIDSKDNLNKTINDHINLVNAIVEKDYDNAYELYYEHIFGSYFIVSKQLIAIYPDYFILENTNDIINK